MTADFVSDMAAIANTDVIQAGIIPFGFMFYYTFQSTMFGGIPATTEAFLNCARLYDDDTFGVAKCILNLP